MPDWAVKLGDSALDDIDAALRAHRKGEAIPPKPAPAKGAPPPDTRSHAERLRDEGQALRERNAKEAAARYGELRADIELVALEERTKTGTIAERVAAGLELAERKRAKGAGP